jgi:hypothetical protein
MTIMKKVAMLTAVVALGAASNAQALSIEWTGNGLNDNWNNGANWVGGTPPGSADIAVFKMATPVNCQSPTTVGAIQVDAAVKVTIAAGDLNVISSGSFIVTSAELEVVSILTMQNANMANDGLLTVTGTGVANFESGASITGSGETHLDNGGVFGVTGASTCTCDIASTQLLSDDGGAIWSLANVGTGTVTFQIHRNYAALSGAVEFTSGSQIRIDSFNFTTTGASSFPSGTICNYVNRTTGQYLSAGANDCP